MASNFGTLWVIECGEFGYLAKFPHSNTHLSSLLLTQAMPFFTKREAYEYICRRFTKEVRRGWVPRRVELKRVG